MILGNGFTYILLIGEVALIIGVPAAIVILLFKIYRKLQAIEEKLTKP